ncbi:lipoprotein [Spiroplasma endosymbiont of Diplazon laetatorius]|uniref:lipoprotein n=1 Tax=Spiroplasma endosymbiont of Diplazon laetatorius TaxID=3066322 RepID=UPI0030CEA0C4
MKKLLSLFGAISLVPVSSAVVVSCNDKNISTNMVEIRDMRNNYVDTVDKTTVKDFKLYGGIQGGTDISLYLFFKNSPQKYYPNLIGTKEWFNKYLNKLIFNIE